MQEIDERTADLNNKKAAVKSGQANVERLEALAGYKKITVPFDGVVTSRETDVGALINAGGGAGPAMFVVSDIASSASMSTCRRTTCPRSRSARRRAGDAGISEPHVCGDGGGLLAIGRCIFGHDAHAARARQCDGELMPGGYANVRLPLLRDAVPLHIPASALIFNKDGLRVATVGPDDKVLFKTVTIARDLGKEIELASGLAADDRVITAPPDGIADGDQVRVVGADAKGKPATASEKQDVKG
jgi:multidrug efflux pump subunit AcrA (membrane-fusion protein)